jgi:1-phosphofructokinase
MKSIITVTLNPTIDRIIEVPDFRVNEHLPGRLRWRAPAGKALNVSRVLATLGTPNTAMGWVGQESIADFCNVADTAGFTARFRPIAGPSRENITIVDPNGHTATHIRDAGPTVTEADVSALTAELESVASADTFMVFMGALPQGISPNAFGLMLDACIARGANIVVDAYGEALREAAKCELWLVKPNRHELADLLGTQPGNETEIVAAGRVLNLKFPYVLVTLGDAGAYAFSQDGVWRAHVTIPPDQIRSTVGCGDTFLAAFLSVIVNEPGDVEQALRQATAIAGASAMHELPATFDRGTVEMLLSKIETERL